MKALVFTLLLLVMLFQPARLLAGVFSTTGPIVEEIFAGGLRGQWRDGGWAPRDLSEGSPAVIQMTGRQGWMIVRPHLSGRFGAITFRLRAKRGGEFIQMQLAGPDDTRFPVVPLTALAQTPRADGFVFFTAAMTALNPRGKTFDRITWSPSRSVARLQVELDDIALHATADQSALDVITKTPYPSFEATMHVACKKNRRPINPRIYGIAYSAQHNQSFSHQWQLNPSIRRFGGNATSRYNWKIGNAWNAGVDWFFANVNYSGNPNFTWRDFLDESRVHQSAVALTVPTLGFVAKDTTSFAFPVDVYGPQEITAKDNPRMGNGKTPNGELLAPRSPEQTSVAAPPAFVKAWVEAIALRNKHFSHRHVDIYFLDNEPMLWNVTHRDVHPEATGYDEVLERTLSYGAAIRQADPQALIAGPCVWGWSSYFFSAKDHQAGYLAQPDRRAHGHMPFLEWYLRALRKHEKQHGVRVLDMLDVHFYPQGEGIYAKARNDADAADRRIRATRALWDTAYRDESWIDEPVYLIPRMRALIDSAYPGLALSIGEYNFGGEFHQSGALALAEALGRFGRHGADAAYYWNTPPAKSNAAYAFAAFRNYDGKKSTFLPFDIETQVTEGTSLFVSSNAKSDKFVAIALNFSPREAANVVISFSECGVQLHGKVFYYTGMREGIIEGLPVATQGGLLQHRLPPYSITIFELVPA